MREREINRNNSAHGKKLHCVKVKRTSALYLYYWLLFQSCLFPPATRDSAVIKVASGWVLGRGRTAKVKFNRLDPVFQWQTG
jgi:hypothetical protein